MILYPQIPFEYSTIAIVVNGLQKQGWVVEHEY